MTLIQDVNAEELARLFHLYHEILASDFDCEADCSPSWEETPEKERKRLTAAARLALDELKSLPGKVAPSPKKYFAKPGEAEWGC
jgi:hypothetical protein